MRMPPESANFKKFYGAAFLSDFTVVIQCETSLSADPPPPAISSSHAQGAGTADTDVHHNLLHTKALSLPEPLVGSAAPCSGQQDVQTSSSTVAASDERPPLPPFVLHTSSSHTSSTAAASTKLAESNHDSSITSNNNSSGGNSSSTGLEVISVPVHGVVLAAASPYFETLLRDWKSSSNTIHMVVAEDQMAAAQVLLQFMYSSSVPATLPQHDLLQLLLLADRFDVRRAAAAASRVLGALSPAALEWQTLQGIWSLPEHLYEADEQTPVRTIAWNRLMQLFGDLEDSWATADGRSLFQQLPLRAVMELVSSDKLAVASENTVFAALSSWIAHASVNPVAGRQLSQHDLKVLAASVRLPGMGPCYLSYVALQHEWFRQTLDVMSLARAAAFSAASADVRKDLKQHTAATTAQALAAAAAAAAASGATAAAVPAAVPCISDTGSSSVGHSRRTSFSGCCMYPDHSNALPCGAAAAAGLDSSSRCGMCPVCTTPEQQAQLLSLAQAMQQPRAVSCRRTCFFQWHVDLAAIKQLHEEVAAAGSRDSRILRSPAHCFAGYEWALQLEITQVRGTTGFDPTKPWALGVFLTCQVRVDVPSKQQEPAAGPAAVYAAAAAAGEGGQAGGLDVGSSSGGVSGMKQQQSSPVQQQQQLLMQLVDFGFVSTAATISVREVGSKEKKCEKSWEHAVVRYRASWGWPNYLDVSAMGWDESVFEKWVIDGQMHLQASVRVLG